MYSFSKKDIAAILKGEISKDLKIQTEYSDLKTFSQKSGTPSWYWKAIKTDPMEWLGKEHITGTPEWEKMHRIHQKIFDKVMSEQKND